MHEKTRPLYHLTEEVRPEDTKRSSPDHNARVEEQGDKVKKRSGPNHNVRGADRLYLYTLELALRLGKGDTSWIAFNSKSTSPRMKIATGLQRYLRIGAEFSYSPHEEDGSETKPVAQLARVLRAANRRRPVLSDLPLDAQHQVREIVLQYSSDEDTPDMLAHLARAGIKLDAQTASDAWHEMRDEARWQLARTLHNSHDVQAHLIGQGVVMVEQTPLAVFDEMTVRETLREVDAVLTQTLGLPDSDSATNSQLVGQMRAFFASLATFSRSLKQNVLDFNPLEATNGTLCEWTEVYKASLKDPEKFRLLNYTDSFERLDQVWANFLQGKDAEMQRPDLEQRQLSFSLLLLLLVPPSEYRTYGECLEVSLLNPGEPEEVLLKDPKATHSLLLYYCLLNPNFRETALRPYVPLDSSKGSPSKKSKKSSKVHKGPVDPQNFVIQMSDEDLERFEWLLEHFKRQLGPYQIKTIFPESAKVFDRWAISLFGDPGLTDWKTLSYVPFQTLKPYWSFLRTEAWDAAALFTH